MVAYKVVGIKTRLGSNATGWEWEHAKPLKDFFTLYPEYKKFKEYFPRYLKGKTIKAVEGTIGIMCFATRKDAREFQRRYACLLDSGEIITVKGIGTPVQDFKIKKGGMSIKDLFEEDPYLDWAPCGAIAFKSIKVLE